MSNPGVPLNYTEGEKEGWTPEMHKLHKATMERNVFGADAKRDGKGRPIEQGIGAPGHETENHFRSIGKYEGPEAEKAAREKAKKAAA